MIIKNKIFFAKVQVITCFRFFNNEKFLAICVTICIMEIEKHNRRGPI